VFVSQLGDGVIQFLVRGRVVQEMVKCLTRNDSRRESALCLPGLHVFDDGRSNFSENPIAAEGAFDFGSHRQLVCGKLGSTIDTLIEQTAWVPLSSYLL
jgi:hypothetical protein